MRQPFEFRPARFREAKALVARWHRHHNPPQGHLFSLAALVGGEPCGVCVVGRPVARRLDDGTTCEVTRLATDGTTNACSFLLGAARRAAQALGYRRLLTYTLPEEGGASLRAAGWVPAGRTAGGSWSHPSRRRTDRAPTCAKLRWSCPLRGRHDAQGAWRASAGGLSPGER
jgi:hypothetical protein